VLDEEGALDVELELELDACDVMPGEEEKSSWSGYPESRVPEVL